MDSWLLELRQAARRLAHLPAFTAAVVLTLGLGLGAIVAAFAVVNAVLLRPLPYPDSERIVTIQHHAPGLNVPELELSEGAVRLYRTWARSLDPLAVYYRLDRNLTGSDRPARVSVVDVSPEFFDVVRTGPAVGTRFTEDDVAPGAEPVAILTDAGWRAHFGADPGVVGRDVEIDGRRTRIIGIMPRGFYVDDPNAVLLMPRRVDPYGSFGTFGLRGIARLAPGVTLDDARREVAAIQERIPEMFPHMTAEWLRNAGWRASVTPLRDRVVRDVETVLWVVFGAVVVIFLVALANVANLYLVRVEGRGREMAVRAALGAGSGRIFGSFFAESVILSIAGGLVGLGAAALATRALTAFAPAELPRIHEVRIDGTVLLVAVLTSAVVGLTVGALAVVRQSRKPIDGALRGARSTTGSPERHRARKALVAAQVAAALVLLTGSGLMVRSFQRLRAVEPGVRTEGVLTVGVSLGEPDSAAVAASLYQRILDEVAAIPGVTAAGASSSLPTLVDDLNGSSFFLRSRPRAEDEVPPIAM